FTNKAAAEMRERVDVLLSEALARGSAPAKKITLREETSRKKTSRAQPAPAKHRVTVSTFHSLGARLLRRHSRAAGLSWGFSILDDDDQKRLIRQVAQELEWEDERRELNRLAGFIDEMKNAGRT